MIEESGIVESLDDKYAYIRAKRTGSCEGCASKSLCHSTDGEEYVIVQTINQIGAKVGNTVRYEVPSGAFLKASLLVYAVPVIALLIGGFVGKVLHPYLSRSVSKDGLSAICAFFFLLVSIIIIKTVEKGTGNDKYIPKITNIIG